METGALCWCQKRNINDSVEDMIMVMLEVARTSLKMLGTDIFEQLSKR